MKLKYWRGFFTLLNLYLQLILRPSRSCTGKKKCMYVSWRGEKEGEKGRRRRKDSLIDKQAPVHAICISWSVPEGCQEKLKRGAGQEA